MLANVLFDAALIFQLKNIPVIIKTSVYPNLDSFQHFSYSFPGSATLHAWQQLAQPHMGALLDHRPGVVTKGFRTLEHEREQQEQEGWQLDQPEEDEVSCDSFVGLSGDQCAVMDQSHSTSSPSACYNKNRDVDENIQSDSLQGEICGAREPIQVKDGHVANMPLLFSRPSPSSSPLPSSSEMNGHVDLKELQALRAASMDRIPGEGAFS